MKVYHKSSRNCRTSFFDLALPANGKTDFQKVEGDIFYSLSEPNFNCTSITIVPYSYNRYQYQVVAAIERSHDHASPAEHVRTLEICPHLFLADT